MDKKRIAIIIGSGFSSALTSGDFPILGNAPLPTLTDLTDGLMSHMELLVKNKIPVPFEETVINKGITLLRENLSKPEPERYNFEELLSLLSVESDLARSPNLSEFSNLQEANPQIFSCILYCLSNFFLSRLSYNSATKANRNFFYKVNDQERAIAFKEGIWHLTDEFEVTFVSFNWDGIIESFLDHWLGQDRGFRYFIELSHAIPIVMPEHVYSRKDNRDLSRQPRFPIIVKPHGSIHFFQLREELRNLMSGPTIAAIHPRLDIGFNGKTMQRDIPNIQFWEFADPTPVVVPPLLSKSSYFSNNYFQAMIRLMINSLQKSDTY